MGFSTSNAALARDIVSDRVAPPFLQGPNGSAWLTAMGQAMDAVRYRSAQAMLAPMPGQGDSSALPYLGADYLLVQGPGETNAQFVARNSGAYDFWQHAGNDWALLQVALSQVLPSTPAAFVVSNSARWSYYAAGANPAVPPTVFFAGTINSWDWDNQSNFLSEATDWWRVWLCLYSVAPNAWATQWATLGGGLPTLGSAGAAAGSLGFANVTPGFWNGLRAMLLPVKQAGAWLRWIIVSFSSALFSPDGYSHPAAGAANPDGNWATGYKIVVGMYQAAWDANAAPVPGVPGVPGGTIGPSIDHSTLSNIATGTVTLANGSPTVNGTGTHFQSVNGQVNAGQLVQFSSQPGVSYTVQSITSDTVLTLSTPFTGIGSSGVTMSVISTGYRIVGGQYLPA